jgi:hypothetical protein
VTSQSNGTPAPVAEAVPWARQATAAKPRATQRVRKIVEGLPAWEPMPPGEIVVRRGREV